MLTCKLFVVAVITWVVHPQQLLVLSPEDGAVLRAGSKQGVQMELQVHTK
jgi:hypothetical protein